MNEMYMHYCGGAGINIGRDINRNLTELGDGFCKITAKYLDTSGNNVSENEDLWKINTATFAGPAVSGSGGERRTNAGIINTSVSEYLDKNKLLVSVTGVFHIVVFSGSGGSGSVIGPILISKLRARGVPVLGVMVGDSSNGLCCKNTLNTISTLDHMAKVSVKKPITIIYYNNMAADGSTHLAKEAVVNNMCYNALAIMSMFLSGANEDIDTKDMTNFLAPDNYTSVTVPDSLYCITFHDNDNQKCNDGVINLIGRTLTAPGKNGDMKLTLLQHKYGKVISPNVIEKMSDTLPVHAVLVGNLLSSEHSRLTHTVSEYDAISAAIKTEDLCGTTEAGDDGLIF